MKERQMTKANSPLKDRKGGPAKVHKLDSTNPKLKYIAGSSFDAWNNTIARQATNSIWNGHNADAERIQERQVASLSLLAGISPNDNSRECWQTASCLAQRGNGMLPAGDDCRADT